jgi:hypothetical protein
MNCPVNSITSLRLSSSAAVAMPDVDGSDHREVRFCQRDFDDLPSQIDTAPPSSRLPTARAWLHARGVSLLRDTLQSLECVRPPEAPANGAPSASLSASAPPPEHLECPSTRVQPHGRRGRAVAHLRAGQYGPLGSPGTAAAPGSGMPGLCSPRTYQRCQPENTVLYRILQAACSAEPEQGAVWWLTGRRAPRNCGLGGRPGKATSLRVHTCAADHRCPPLAATGKRAPRAHARASASGAGLELRRPLDGPGAACPPT